MSQNISLWGATYSDVPSVLLPKSGGGTARFDDTTIASNAATASDILSGKYAYVNGSLIQGTGTGGGGSVTQDQDGYIVLPATGGGTPSVSGLVYETGTWTPSSDIADYTISFANTHTTAPFYYMITDTEGTYIDTANTNYCMEYLNFHQLFGVAQYTTSSSQKYGYMYATYRYSSTSLSNSSSSVIYPYTDTGEGNSNYSRYWAKETEIRAYTGSTNRYWRSGRTYKWIAVWAPTT